MANKCNVVRIHLKTGGTEGAVNRENLMDFCLRNQAAQYVVVGWSCAYEGASTPVKSFDDYYRAVREWNEKEKQKYGGTYRMNPAINRFYYTKENDLFWTRDTDGNHWICRAKGGAEAYLDETLDIGARVPVEAYPCGIDVPGQIKASFTRARGGIAETLRDDLIVDYSQYMFNKLSGRSVYTVSRATSESILDNLPPFDLEELVISYIQVAKGYYVLSNSLAQNSTTIKIECEFRSRDKDNPKRAVVQVKGGKDKEIDALDYAAYDRAGYVMYFFAPSVLNIEKLTNGVWITREELLNFYSEYKAILPDSITQWESLFH